tara:strand:- start:31 stop:378 length:348 start_codon:yes stop_codon:yes gene_type:complete
MQAALKSLVIGLGILIIFSMALLVYGFYKSSQDPNWRLFRSNKAESQTASKPVAKPAPPIAATGDIELNLPTGCEIKAVTQSGGKIFILTQPAGVCGEVMIVDPATGQVTGRIKP